MKKITFIDRFAGNAKYDKQIFGLAIPALGALIADPLVSLVDTAFVGHIDTVSLGALGLNTAIFSLAVYAFSFLSSATTTHIAQHLGANEKEKAEAVATASIITAIISGILVSAFIYFMSRPILILMGASGPLLEAADSYLIIRAFAIPAVFITFAGHGIFRGFLDTKIPLAIALLYNIINAILDPIFIFYFDFGIKGAAIATVIAQWTGAAIFILQFTRNKPVCHINFKKINFASFARLLRAGAHLSLRSFCLVGVFAFSNAIAARISTVTIAAHQIALELWLLSAYLIDSLAIAAQTMVGNFLGHHDVRSAREVSKRVLGYSFALGILVMISILGFAALIPKIFTTDAKVLLAVATVMPIIAFVQPLNSLVFAWDGIFLGTGDFKFLAKVMIVATITSTSLMLLVIPLGWGLKGLWLGAFVNLIFVRASFQAYKFYLDPNCSLHWPKN